MAKILSARSVTQIPARFAIQSYMEQALGAQAILNQALGSPIVASTKQSAQTPGVGLALHPSSQSPVAVRFRGGNADSAEVILVPGQRIDVGAFESFEWGLPFGWLGGGTVLLYVIHRPDAAVDFPAGNPRPVLFQRMSLSVLAAAPVPIVPNWPNTFPWVNAINGVDTTPQGGAPIVNVVPTLTMFRLRSELAAPVTLSLQWESVDAFDLDDTGLVVVPARITQSDLSFPSVPNAVGWPVAWLTEELSRFAGYATSLTIIDPTGVLDGTQMDILRYGRLG